MTLLAALGLGAALAGLVATYLAYPIVVIVWGGLRARGRPRAPAPGEPPFVSFVVIAHNEADAIRAKLENTLALDWPADRFEVIVASDASSDGTDAIVSAATDPRVRLVRNPERGGKTATTRLAVEAARGPVLVFSDATGVYDRGAIRALVAPLADPGVGAVSGRVVYRYGESETARGFRLYQRWVVAQRRGEAGLGAVTSVSGAIHALRRELFEVVPAHLSYDMVVPALAAMRGLRSVYAADAICFEASRLSVNQEFEARVRMALQSYGFVAWLWNARARVPVGMYLNLLLFGKVIRWFSVHLLAVALLLHVVLALTAVLPMASLLPHAAFWAVAFWLLAHEGRPRFPGSAVVLLFATVCTAHATAFGRWLGGSSAAAWTPDRVAERHRDR